MVLYGLSEAASGVSRSRFGGLPKFLRPEAASGGNLFGGRMDIVITALPDGLSPRQMALGHQRLYRRLNCAIRLAALGHKCPHGRPAGTLVIGAISQSQQDQLFAIRQRRGPNLRHDANAHFTTRNSMLG